MNPRPTGYEPAGLPDCPTPQKQVVWNLGLLVEAPDPCIHIITHKREEGAYGHYIHENRKSKVERKKQRTERGIMLGDKNEDDCEGDSYKTTYPALTDLVAVIHEDKNPGSFLFYRG